ncbi:MAG TPA: sigma-70 family RNA polymerase sigma factor [Opitutaceae bacterium]|jgi:RNA polymerase sigma factor (TIGR02999 family)
MSGDVTLILQRVGRGDELPAERLLPLVYDELRKIAAGRMAREAPGQTLQATALVHEAWLRLGGDAQPAWQNRAHFFSAAAEAMRRILIDNARRRQAQRHGGGLEKVNLDATGFEIAAPLPDDEILVLHEALEALAAYDARKAELVKMRYFIGLTQEEAAHLLGISTNTADRDWAFSRAWLFEKIEEIKNQK